MGNEHIRIHWNITPEEKSIRIILDIESPTISMKPLAIRRTPEVDPFNLNSLVLKIIVPIETCVPVQSLLQPGIIFTVFGFHPPKFGVQGEVMVPCDEYFILYRQQP